jgi:hypothetical protein
MKADQTSQLDGTALFLAEECVKTQTCLNNVIKLIDDDKYDIIGLQEAANYNIIKTTSQNLKDMGCIHHALSINGNIIDLITFYNQYKFKVLAVKVGNIDRSNTDGRPYHIIFLEYISTSDKYIIINLHNGKNPGTIYNKEPLQETLGTDINNLFIVNDSDTRIDFINIEQETVSDGVRLFSNTFKTIVLGDFNDHESKGENYWYTLQPFKYTHFLHLNSIVVSSIIKPPITCCTGYNSLRTSGDTDRFIGDYILIDNSLKYIENNTIVDYYRKNLGQLSSDHQPIYAIIETPSAVPAAVPAAVPPAVPVAKQETMPLFYVKESRTLRLLNDSHNPNDSAYINHKRLCGLTIDENSTLTYPLQNITFQNPNEKYMYVVDKYDPNIIGYINKKYLISQNPTEYTVTIPRTLRLLANNQDPEIGTIGRNYHHGATVTLENILILPNGEITDNNFVLICDLSDPNKVGYINKNYLLPIVNTYHRKYIKYKYKYLQYKKILQ